MPKPFFLKCLMVPYLALSLSGCIGSDENSRDEDLDYKQLMRTFVQDLSSWAKTQSPGFLIIPQNGHELATTTGETDGEAATTFIASIDGAGQEDLFYGYGNDNQATPASDNNYLLNFLNIYEANGVEVLVTDYCSTPSLMDKSYTDNLSHSFISFAADHRNLDNIPTYPDLPHNVNSNNITTLSEAQNFLYLLDTKAFSNKDAFTDALSATNYDLFIIDLYVNDTALTKTDLHKLKQKANGGTRLLICYMSIGEAEDYRYYWNSEWVKNPPAWLEKENPEWLGNYKVRYWQKDWQRIIFGNENSYLQKIIEAGFDGVYLDIIEGFEYFE
ncbi:MAG: endo alpha-1,4 polygalactosaminidase [Fibrobacteria bacterium]|nr:endo alpha-1,4 polygalactosaminidase [Fibrobacteria bacterium]